MTLTLFCLIYLVIGSVCGLATFLSIKAIDRQSAEWIQENKAFLHQLYTTLDTFGLAKALIILSLLWPLAVYLWIALGLKKIFQPNTTSI